MPLVTQEPLYYIACGGQAHPEGLGIEEAWWADLGAQQEAKDLTEQRAEDFAFVCLNCNDTQFLQCPELEIAPARHKEETCKYQCFNGEISCFCTEKDPSEDRRPPLTEIELDELPPSDPLWEEFSDDLFDDEEY